MVASRATMKRASQLQTERLILRPYTRKDIPDIVRLIGAREIAATTLRIPHPYTEQDARALLRKLAKEKPPTHFGIFLRDTGEYCGGIGLTPDQDHDRAEIGYWIGVPYWGRGIASEAACEVVRFGFETLGLNRIFATCYVGNHASTKILAKLGMKHEGRFLKHIKKWGEYKNVDNYGLLAEDWKAARR
jgi:RimJ/RimL family protein N-acetyltransferase